MKKSLILVLLISSFGKVKADTTSVLFVGNSITYYNNMPQTFQNIANSLGDTVFIDQHTPGGTGFVNHVTNNTMYNLFKQRDWDYIVLQPGSNESPGYSSPISQTLERGRIMLDSIYKYNPCVQVLYQEISYGVWGSTAANLQTYNYTMDSIRKNLTILADSTQLFFAPVGEAFRSSWNNNQNNMLWGGNGDIHPNTKGSYIAASVFYASIFQKPSAASSILNGFSVADALNYRELADSVVLNHVADWRINTYKQTVDFNYITNSNLVQFNNLSQNYDRLFWDFGDGFSSTDILPSHLYLNANNHTVNLTSYKHNCPLTVSKTLSLLPLGIDSEYSKNNIKIYPNPTNDYLFIDNSQEDFIYTGYNSIGKIVFKTKSIKINVSELPSGIYFVEMQNVNNNEIKRLKWIKL